MDSHRRTRVLAAVVAASVLTVLGLWAATRPVLIVHDDGDRTGVLTAGMSGGGGVAIGYAHNPAHSRASFGMMPLCIRSDARTETVRIVGVRPARLIGGSLDNAEAFIRTVELGAGRNPSSKELFFSRPGSPPFDSAEVEGRIVSAVGATLGVRCAERNGWHHPSAVGRVHDLVISADDDGERAGGWDGVVVAYEDDGGRSYELTIPFTLVVCGDAIEADTEIHCDL